MNRGLHCPAKFCVHAPERVLDLLKCLYSFNNKFILFTHVLFGKCKCFPSFQLIKDTRPFASTEDIWWMFCIDWFHLTLMQRPTCLFLLHWAWPWLDQACLHDRIKWTVPVELGEAGTRTVDRFTVMITTYFPPMGAPWSQGHSGLEFNHPQNCDSSSN